MKKDFLLKITVVLSQFVLAGLLMLLIVFITIALLNKYTNHGKEFAAPYLINSTLDEIKSNDKYSNIDIVIVDSIYNKNYGPGVVLQQMPKAGSAIKPGRKVYLVVSSVSPGETPMPNLIDVTIRQAISTLQSSGLILGEITYKSSFDKDAVQAQTYRGENIEPGTMIHKGSVIDLVVSAGLESMATTIPFLYGENVVKCRQMLRDAYLNIGSEFYYDTDDVNDAVAYKYFPEWDGETIVPMGTKVDVYYGSKDRFSPDSLKFVMNFPLVHRDSAAVLYADTFCNVKLNNVNFDSIVKVLDSILFASDTLLLNDIYNDTLDIYNFDEQ